MTRDCVRLTAAPGEIDEANRKAEEMPSANAKNGDDKNGNRKNGNGNEKSEPKKTPGPRTAPRAICKYLRSLHYPESERSNGESTDERSPPAFGSDDNARASNGSSNAREGGSNSSGAANTPGGNSEDGYTPRGERSTAAFGEEGKGGAEGGGPSWYSAHAQSTVVTQKHNVFTSPYMSNLSLQPHEPSATSETGTIYFDARLWEGDIQTGEVIFDPEIAGGRGLSGSNGVAGFPNGEITRVGIPAPTPYIARLYLRETFGFGGEKEKVEDTFNQIAGERDVDRLTVVVGKFSFSDLMDDNRYSHDPRTQFLPWSFMYNGAWDFPANVRGYSYGIGVELNQKTWALRYGMMQMPRFANSAPLAWEIKGFGYALELEKRYKICDRPGKVRLMPYLNHAKMGNYFESVAVSPQGPDITATRSWRYKYGFCMNWEQELCKDVGMWARLGWNDGQSESFAFTPIDRTVTFGWLIRGGCWHRRQDTVGIGFGFNGLSSAHREYLAAGGQDFNLGDGALNYRPEEIMEYFYNWELIKNINITFDMQGISNPAYNHDRGPVAVWTIRAHMEF